MLLIAAIAMTLATAFLFTSRLGVRERAAVFAGVYVASLGVIVVVCEIGGLAHRLTPGFLLLLHAVLLVGVFAWWRRGGAPLPARTGPWWDPVAWLGRPHQHPALWLLAVGVAVVVLINAVLVAAVPPNNWDSMTYHLARIGYWLQHQTFYPWNTHNVRQTMFPLNAELLQMWSILFAGTDRAAGLVQWTAGLAAIAGVAVLAGAMGASKRQSLFAGLLWATFPQALLQSTTTQNDLILAATVLCTLYLLLRGFQCPHDGMLWLSGLGVGLIVGMKLTWAFLVPGVALSVLLLLWQQRARVLRPLRTWVMACLAGVLLLAALTYAQNALAYGHPLGARSFAQKNQRAPGLSLAERGFYNVIRHTYQAADLTGVPYIAAMPIMGVKAELFDATAGRLLPERAKDRQAPRRIWGLNSLYPPIPHEDVAWFGPIFFLLIVPLSAFHAWRAVRKRDPICIAVLLVGYGMFLTGSTLLGWSQWNGRIFVPAAAVLTPLCAWAYRPGWSPWSLGVVGFAGLVTLWVTMVNPQKPLLGPRAVWARDAIGQRAAAFQWPEVMLALNEECLPADATVGLMLRSDDWDYPLFGPSFGRRLVPICSASPLAREMGAPSWGTVLHARDYPAWRSPRYSNCETIDRAWVREQGITHLVVAVVPHGVSGHDPDGFETLARTPTWRLLRVLDAKRPARAVSYTPSTARQYWEPEHGPIIEVGSSFAGSVGIWGYTGPSWDFGEWKGETVVWLGHGAQNGLTCSFWSDAAREVVLVVDVAFAPRLPDGTPELECYFETTGVRTNRIASFPLPDDKEAGLAQPVSVSFPLRLSPGYNYVSLNAISSSPPQPPAGPFLLLLKSVRIAQAAADRQDRQIPSRPP